MSGRTQNGPVLALFKDGQIFTERFTNSGGNSFQLVRGNLFEASDLENDEHCVAFVDQSTRNQVAVCQPICAVFVSALYYHNREYDHNLSRKIGHLLERATL